MSGGCWSGFERAQEVSELIYQNQCIAIYAVLLVFLYQPTDDRPTNVADPDP